MIGLWWVAGPLLAPFAARGPSGWDEAKLPGRRRVGRSILRRGVRRGPSPPPIGGAVTRSRSGFEVLAADEASVGATGPYIE